MDPDKIDYPAILQDALRDAVRRVLEQVAEHGLPGEHHFFIGFRTGFPGVQVPRFLREQYPEEVTIILQHQFWELEVTPDDFSVVLLSFGGPRQRLVVPFAALTAFADPSADFGLRFEASAQEEAAPAPAPRPESRPRAGAVGRRHPVRSLAAALSRPRRNLRGPCAVLLWRGHSRWLCPLRAGRGSEVPTMRDTKSSNPAAGPALRGRAVHLRLQPRRGPRRRGLDRARTGFPDGGAARNPAPQLPQSVEVHEVAPPAASEDESAGLDARERELKAREAELDARERRLREFPEAETRPAAPRRETPRPAPPARRTEERRAEVTPKPAPKPSAAPAPAPEPAARGARRGRGKTGGEAGGEAGRSSPDPRSRPSPCRPAPSSTSSSPAPWRATPAGRATPSAPASPTT